MQYIIAEETKGVLNMREYVTPRMTGETFASNEYISVCWGVKCDTSWANWFEKRYDYWDNGNVSHATDHCGNSSNQVIYDHDNNGIGEAMVETGTSGLGTLECTIYTGYNRSTGRYTGEISVSKVHIGQEIYWTTSSGDRTWHHKGIITATAEGHPNRS